jgi:serine/threonine protein kinase
MIDMLKALHYCHNVIKLIHKDIKPDNIVINK